MELSALEVAEATDGKSIDSLLEKRFTGVSTDSRTVRPGELFVPLVGEHLDGHDFIPDALRHGAAGFLFHRELMCTIPPSVTAIRVSDTLQALGDLATWAARRLNARIIAVVGSNGKTTTKELIAHMLSQGFCTHATIGNQNTEIGLPLTVLNAPEDTERLVLEMGTNALGDVKRLCQIAQPHVGVLTGISEEHITTLGSLEQVIEAETELIEALPPDGLAIINGDSPEVLEVVRRKARCRLMTFGCAAHNDFSGEDVKLSRAGTRFYVKSPEWQSELSIPLLGRPAVLAALAATAVAQYGGLSFSEIRRALSHARGVWGRLQLVPIPGTAITVLHDAYNANPASMREAILCAAQLRYPDEELIFVLGDMLELGPISERAHREIGQLVTKLELRPDQLIVVGPWAQLIGDEASHAGLRVNYFASADEAAETVFFDSEERRLILLKGSRGMRLEQLLDVLSHHIPLPV
jgi:UDP-N-acetylmuramoyl-tripeptide--D-alanyl-D-alanine ligase